MKNVREVPIYKASPVGDQVVPEVSILIAGDLPAIGDLEAHSEFYGREAEKILEALKSLPGGPGIGWSS